MSIRNDILAAARERFGVPYRIDPPPDGVHTLDCSLYVLKVFEAAGLPIPAARTAEQIRQSTVPVDWSDVLPGDLLFFEHTYNAAGPAGPDGKIASHVGISLGTGTKRMYDANDAHGTGETNIGTPYWQDHIFEARRHPALMGGPPTEPSAMTPGIDVSNHQGTIDWEAVAGSGKAFAFIKASEGTGYRDPFFATNWAGARANGMARGAYHFARPNDNSPEDEAAYFLAIVQGQGIEAGDMLVLDLEAGAGALGGWALRWLQRVQALTGVTPILYTGPWIISGNNLDRVPELAAYPLWLASYRDGWPEAPDPWSDVAFWQYSDKTKVAGIAGNVDGNWFNGPRSGLAAFGKGGSPEPGPTPNTRLQEIAAQMAALTDELQRLVKAEAA